MPVHSGDDGLGEGLGNSTTENTDNTTGEGKEMVWIRDPENPSIPGSVPSVLSVVNFLIP
jgi:hypothetical protein